MVSKSPNSESERVVRGRRAFSQTLPAAADQRHERTTGRSPSLCSRGLRFHHSHIATGMRRAPLAQLPVLAASSPGETHRWSRVSEYHLRRPRRVLIETYSTVAVYESTSSIPVSGRNSTRSRRRTGSTDWSTLTACSSTVPGTYGSISRASSASTTALSRPATSRRRREWS